MKEINFDKNQKAVIKISKWNYQNINELKGLLQYCFCLKNVTTDDALEWIFIEIKDRIKS